MRSRMSSRVSRTCAVNGLSSPAARSISASASPTRHSLLATVILPDVGGWRAEARGEYRVSRYNDPNRLNGGTLVVTRRDDRYGIAARANRRLSALWRVFADYSYYRNDSNLDIYDYGRQQLMVGVEAALEK